MIVANILKDKGDSILSVAPDASVADAVSILAEHRIGAVLVLDGGKLAGILSERDVVKALSKADGGCLDMQVRELMTAEVKTCTPKLSIAEVMEMMTAGRFRHVPVVDGDTLCGMVSIGDVVKWRLEEAQEEVRQMAAYVAGN